MRNALEPVAPARRGSRAGGRSRARARPRRAISASVVHALVPQARGARGTRSRRPTRSGDPPAAEQQRRAAATPMSPSQPSACEHVGRAQIELVDDRRIGSRTYEEQRVVRFSSIAVAHAVQPRKQRRVVVVRERPRAAEDEVAGRPRRRPRTGPRSGRARRASSRRVAAVPADRGHGRRGASPSTPAIDVRGSGPGPRRRRARRRRRPGSACRVATAAWSAVLMTCQAGTSGPSSASSGVGGRA